MGKLGQNHHIIWGNGISMCHTLRKWRGTCKLRQRCPLWKAAGEERWARINLTKRWTNCHNQTFTKWSNTMSIITIKITKRRLSVYWGTQTPSCDQALLQSVQSSSLCPQKTLTICHLSNNLATRSNNLPFRPDTKWLFKCNKQNLSTNVISSRTFP